MATTTQTSTTARTVDGMTVEATAPHTTTSHAKRNRVIGSIAALAAALGIGLGVGHMTAASGTTSNACFTAAQDGQNMEQSFTEFLNAVNNVNNGDTSAEATTALNTARQKSLSVSQTYTVDYDQCVLTKPGQ